MTNNTIGVFHRITPPTARKFDPISVAARLKRFRDFYSGQKWDVRGFTYEGTQHTGPKEYARGDIDALIASGATDGFDPFMRHILGGHKKGGKACGQATQGGRESVSYDEFQCEMDGDTTLHESCHNGLGDGTPSKQGTGLGHSHKLRSDGKVTNMGDESSLMGSGEGEGLISPHICALGWNRPNETIVITETQQVLIAATELQGLHPNEYKHVIVRVKGFNDFYLSTRQDYPFNSGIQHPGRLYIHELCPNGYEGIANDFPNATVLHAALDVGDEIELPNGVGILYDRLFEGIAKSSIYISEHDILQGRAVEYRPLPTFGAPAPSGCYYNPVSNGHGFDVHTHDGTTVVYWYTGNESDDNPRYYFATGEAGAELDLYTTEGTVDNPSGAVETKVGTIRATGNVFCWRLNGVRGGVEVEQLVVPDSSGIYYYEPRKGEGITVQGWNEGCAVFFYTYKGNKQAWYSCEGEFNGAWFDLVVYETKGKMMREKLTTAPCGKGQLVKLDGQVRFSFQADGRDETYVMDLLF